MKSLILILLVLGVAVEGAEPNQGPPTPAILVAKTVVWQAHWDARAGKPVTIPPTITFKMHEQSDVWINGLDWVITFVYEDDQPFPHFVQRFSSSSDEERQEIIKPFLQAADVAVKVPAYEDTFRRLSTIKAENREKLLNAFKHEACSTNMLAFYRNQIGQPIKKARFWIAPVDLDFPVVLYIVEGVPYVGRVDFSTHSLKPLYSDFDYIGDEDTEPHQQGLKMIKAIKAEGDQFELHDGKLIPVH